MKVGLLSWTLWGGGGGEGGGGNACLCRGRKYETSGGHSRRWWLFTEVSNIYVINTVANHRRR